MGEMNSLNARGYFYARRKLTHEVFRYFPFFVTLAHCEV